MSGRSPFGQHQQGHLYGYPHIPYTFVPGYLRFQPTYSTLDASTDLSHHLASPQPRSPLQAIQHGQGGSSGKQSWESFYTLPKRTPVKISKPEETTPLQAMVNPTTSSHPTSGMGTASTVPSKPTSDSASSMPIDIIIRPQPHNVGSMQALSSLNPLLLSSLFSSSPEMTPTITSAPPESDFSLKAKAAVDDDTWFTFSPKVPQPEARSETTPVLPLADLPDRHKDMEPENTSSETDREPIFMRTLIGDGFWAVLALYVERDFDTLQNQFKGLEGRLISDYRDKTPQQLGELVAEAIKDEKKELMEQ
ncbi:hypothetical protein BGZ52_005736 [Haplosporangium bisporale]|nr:hypothetical protein BGZ52_005736 [Haplosporangium bisporale]